MLCCRQSWLLVSFDCTIKLAHCATCSRPFTVLQLHCKCRHCRCSVLSFLPFSFSSYCSLSYFTFPPTFVPTLCAAAISNDCVSGSSVCVSGWWHMVWVCQAVSCWWHMVWVCQAVSCWCRVVWVSRFVVCWCDVVWVDCCNKWRRWQATNTSGDY